MVLDISSDESSSYCSFCGTKIDDVEIQQCLECEAIFCIHCANHLQINGMQLKCPCGSSNIGSGSPTKNAKVEILEQIFELKKSLKKVAYRSVIVLKRTGHLESRLRNFRKQFLIPRNQLDHIFLETKKIENFILTEFQENCSKLYRVYSNIMGYDSSIVDYRNLALKITLFQKQVRSFDQTVLGKLEPIQDMINAVEKQCDEFDSMAKNLARVLNIFVLTPGELGIGYFSNIELNSSRLRKTTIDMIITTDRIVLLQKRRHNVIGKKSIIHEEFPPEDLIDVQKTTSGRLKRHKLGITTITHDYELYADFHTLVGIFDALQLSYYGRPSDLHIHEAFRDWSSEIYQEKILSALNFQKKSVSSLIEDTEIHSSKKAVPDFVTGVLDDRLRDLRIRKLANEKALQELKEGHRKVANRDYFELVKQFELEIAKINEEITEMLTRTGKTNILHKL